MTTEQDLAKDRLVRAIEMVAHNLRGLRELVDHWVDGELSAEAMAHAVIIREMSADLARSVEHLRQVWRDYDMP